MLFDLVIAECLISLLLLLLLRKQHNFLFSDLR